MGFLQKIRQLFVQKNEELNENLEAIQNIIGYRFRERKWLTLGITHRSYVRANNHQIPSNERLEFLGDSVLGLVIAHQLYLDHPSKREGDLTKIKAMLVNETTLSNIGTSIGIHKHILMSSDEERTGGRKRPSIVSDAFEAIIGAVYLDSGYESASDLVLRLIYNRKDEILSDRSQRNYKGDLLEMAQARGEGMPKYEVLSETGPDHKKLFHIVVSISGKMVGEGKGMSKKEAEQRAAANGLIEYSK